MFWPVLVIFRPLSISLTVTKDSVFTYQIKYFTNSNIPDINKKWERNMDKHLQGYTKYLSFMNSLKSLISVIKQQNMWCSRCTKNKTNPQGNMIQDLFLFYNFIILTFNYTNITISTTTITVVVTNQPVFYKM